MPSRIVYEYVLDRRHFGQLANPTAIGRATLSGSRIEAKIFLRIDNGVVCEGRFQTSGCGYLIASCGAVIDLALRLPILECWRIDSASIIRHLGGIPPSRMFCAELALAALRDALGSLSTVSSESPMNDHQ